MDKPDDIFTGHVTNRELLAELEARIAVTPWRLAFPVHKVDALCLRLARDYISGSKQTAALYALFGALLVPAVSYAARLPLAAIGFSSPPSWNVIPMMVVAVSFGGASVNLALNTCHAVARELQARQPAG